MLSCSRLGLRIRVTSPKYQTIESNNIKAEIISQCFQQFGNRQSHEPSSRIPQEQCALVTASSPNVNGR
jgi:hypothetical protein